MDARLPVRTKAPSNVSQDVDSLSVPAAVLGRVRSRLDEEADALINNAASVHVSHTAHVNQTKP